MKYFENNALQSSVFRRYLRETLKMANAEDLNRLTSCSLVLLGHIFLSLGNSQEALNMVKPAMQLAAKIPDVHVQLWASALLKGSSQILQFFIQFYCCELSWGHFNTCLTTLSFHLKSLVHVLDDIEAFREVNLEKFALIYFQG